MKDVEIGNTVLEEEGLRPLEYWGEEYHPLEELLESAPRTRGKTLPG